MLDSDIGNTIVPMVRFYQKEVQNNFQTLKEGRPVYYMADFVRIEIPGNNLSIIDTFANEYHKNTYPIQWARYQNEKRELGDDQITGTPLSEWPVLNSAQARELRHFKFYTVEQVANASDAQLNAISSIIGMGTFPFRNKARAYLDAAKDSALVDQQNQALQQRDEEIRALKQQMEELMATVQPKGKPGRKPKQPQQVE